MRLPKLALTALALSMSAAWAGGYTHDKSKEQQANAPAGYSDKSSLSTEARGPQDTQRAQPEASGAMTASSAEAAPANAPAGYADKSPIASNTSGAQDTREAQATNGTTLASAEGSATVTTATADTAENVEVIDLRTVRDRDPTVAEREGLATNDARTTLSGEPVGTTLSATTTSEPENAPAGFADKPSITSDSPGAQDTRAAQRTLHGSGGLAMSEDQPKDRPAGYGDKSTLATEATGAQDTAAAQATWQSSAPSTSPDTGAPSNAPAGYGDKSNIATEEEGAQDTKRAQDDKRQ